MIFDLFLIASTVNAADFAGHEYPTGDNRAPTGDYPTPSGDYPPPPDAEEPDFFDCLLDWECRIFDWMLDQAGGDRRLEGDEVDLAAEEPVDAFWTPAFRRLDLSCFTTTECIIKFGRDPTGKMRPQCQLVGDPNDRRSARYECRKVRAGRRLEGDSDEVDLTAAEPVVQIANRRLSDQGGIVDRLGGAASSLVESIASNPDEAAAPEFRRSGWCQDKWDCAANEECKWGWCQAGTPDGSRADSGKNPECSGPKYGPCSGGKFCQYQRGSYQCVW